MSDRQKYNVVILNNRYDNYHEELEVLEGIDAKVIFKSDSEKK